MQLFWELQDRPRKKVGEIYGIQQIHQNTWTPEDHTTWNILHPKKGTIYQVDFYLILTLGPRDGLSYFFVLWYKLS